MPLLTFDKEELCKVLRDKAVKEIIEQSEQIIQDAMKQYEQLLREKVAKLAITIGEYLDVTTYENNVVIKVRREDIKL